MDSGEEAADFIKKIKDHLIAQQGIVDDQYEQADDAAKQEISCTNISI